MFNLGDYESLEKKSAKETLTLMGGGGWESDEN